MLGKEELERAARFRVGDTCYTTKSGPWRITARYWSRKRQCIVYDLKYVYNGVELDRMPEAELTATDDRKRILMPSEILDADQYNG